MQLNSSNPNIIITNDAPKRGAQNGAISSVHNSWTSVKDRDRRSTVSLDPLTEQKEGAQIKSINCTDRLRYVRGPIKAFGV